MQRFRLHALSAVGVLTLLAATPAEPALRRARVGPFEIVPTLGLEIRQHSNVYVTSDEAPEEAVTTDVSGFIIDLRPGISITAKPNLDKQLRGLFFDFRYVPGLSFFPSAPEIEIPCTGDNCDDTFTPDQFKLVHNLYSSIRYQTSPRFNVSAGMAYESPELSQADVLLTDFRVYGGAKYDFNRTMSMELFAQKQRFETPLLFNDSDLNQPLGTFDSWQGRAWLRWDWTPTLTVGARYQYEDRQFEELEVVAGNAQNDLNNDGIPDLYKDYTSHTLEATVTKKLSRQARGTITGGYLWREQDPRQFGRQNYNSFTGSATMETLLSKRTRLQLSAEYMVTDTVREITFEEFNAFTSDQLGQFSVIPQEYSVDYNQRYMLDLIQNVFKRGDQILLGVGYQHDRLEDQLGNRNFFVPGTSTPRPLLGACEVAPDGTLGSGGEYCSTILPNQTNDLLLITAGYRLRLLDWLGVQVRGGWFKETAEYLPSKEDSLLTGARVKQVDTDYWSLSGGMVINLHVFQ